VGSTNDITVSGVAIINVLLNAVTATPVQNLFTIVISVLSVIYIALGIYKRFKDINNS